MDRVVASDLEGTLTSGATWRGVGRYLSEHGQRGPYRRFFWARLPQVLLARLGLIDVQAFRERWMHDLTGFLRGMRRDEVESLADWVFEHELWPRRREAILSELREARDSGARLIVASGTYTPLARRFADRLGAEATGSEIDYDAAGLATGRLLGTMGTGQEKAARVSQALGGAVLATAYGDTAADIPMMGLAQVAVAVHPDKALSRAARSRGWRIVGPAE